MTEVAEPRIVIISHVARDWAGGAACCTLELAAAWRRAGATVNDFYRDELVSVRAGRLSTDVMALAVARAGFPIAQRADIVVATGPLPWALFTRLRREHRRSERPLLVSYTYGLEHFDYKEQRREADAGVARLSRLARARWRLVLRPAVEQSIRLSDAFVVPTRTQALMAEEMGWQARDCVLAIGHGVAREVFDCARGDQSWSGKVAWCGTLVERKGWRYARDGFIDAARILPELTLDVLGSRSDPAAVLAEFPQDVARRVTVLPVLSRAAQFSCLARADVFLSASLSEGYHLALQEALALGVPAIATADGFVADLAAELRPIVEVQKRSSAEVARAILALAANGQLRRKLNQSGRDWASLRSWDVIGEATLRSLLERRRGAESIPESS